jgi:diadenylate cyclase
MPTGLELGILNLIDVAVVATLLWLAIRLMRRTRARAALAGLALLGVIYLLAEWLGLDLTAALFRGFFAVVVLLLIVIFQEDLRRYFEQLGAMLSRSGREVARSDAGGDVLVRTVSRLASQRTGALLVVPGHEPLDRLLEGGIPLGGRLSEPLLLSLFDASSPGHDGAVVVRDGKVERFAAHLPLSTDHAQLGPGGTRHAAGLGLAERCDALCIIVSEERGTISVARDGNLRVLARPEDLLTELYAHRVPRAQDASGWRESKWLEPALAVVGAAVLWMLIVPGSTVVTTTLAAPVVVENLPSELRIEAIDPPSVQVSLTGRRRDLLFLSSNDVSVRVDAYLAKLGRRSFELDPDRVTRPNGADVASLEPERVRIAVAAAEPEPPAPQPAEQTAP